jgi:hypothetical protein
VFELENTLVVAYLFLLSEEIGKKDDVIELSALIRRLQGKLELSSVDRLTLV